MFVGHGGELVQILHLGMSTFFTDMQSSVGNSSIEVSSWLPNQAAMFPILVISYAEVSSSSPQSQFQSQIRMFPHLT